MARPFFDRCPIAVADAALLMISATCAPAHAQAQIDREDERGASWPGPGVAGAIAVQGKYAYAGIRNRLVVTDVSDPRRPVVVGHAGFWPDDPYWYGDVVGIAVSGDFAYVVYHLRVRSALDKDKDMAVFDVSKPAAPALVASYHIPGDMGLRALGVAVSGRYAYVSHTMGLEVVDVSRASAPKHAGSWSTPTPPGGVSVPVWDGSNGLVGDVAVAGLHLAVSGSHAYLADRGGGLRVINVSEPAKPREVGSLAIRGYATGVAVTGKHAFVAGVPFGLRIIDVSDPKQPKDIGTHQTSDRGHEGVTGVVAAGNRAYVHGITPPRPIDTNTHPGGGLRFVDISDPARPRELHPGKGQTPVVDGGVIALAVQGTYAYVGVGRRLVIVGVSDPKHPAVVGSTELLPCSVRDVAVAGHHAFVASERGGLRVLDVSDDTAPKEIGSFRAPGAITSVALSGKFAFAGGEGVLHLLDISDPKSPGQVADHNTRGPIRPDGVPGLKHASNVATIGNYTCVTAGALPVPKDRWPGFGVAGGGGGFLDLRGATVRVLDVSNPVAPKQVGIYEPPQGLGEAPRLASAGEHLLVAVKSPFVKGKAPSLRVVDLSALAWIGRWPYLVALAVVTSMVLALAIVVFRRFLGRYWLLLALIGIALPPLLLLLVPARVPREIGHYDLDGSVHALAVADRHAYLIGVARVAVNEKAWREMSRLWVVDLSDPASPRQLGSCDLSQWGHALHVAVGGSYVYVADGPNGLQVVDVSAPAAPKVTGSCNTSGFARAVAVAGQRAFVANGRSGLRVLDISNPAAPKRLGFYDSPCGP